jgi:hypothetical protein
MTNQERLTEVTHMEKMIREFRIIVAGDADIQGGFGHLPKSDHLPTRVTNIERSINKFHLRGNGVDISGNFDDGFTIS